MYLEYITDSFREYVAARPSLLSLSVIKYVFQVSSGEITFNNNTDYSGQDYILSAIDSTIIMDGLKLENTTVSTDIINIVQSTATISNMGIHNISQIGTRRILVAVSSTVSLLGVRYTDSSLEFLTSSF